MMKELKTLTLGNRISSICRSVYAKKFSSETSSNCFQSLSIEPALYPCYMLLLGSGVCG